ERVTQVKHALGPHYAGDAVAVVVERNGQRLDKEIKLAGKLEPYVLPQLGVLPARDPLAADAPGVPVRAVIAGSAAEKAGVKPGDVIASVGTDSVKDRGQLRTAVFGHKVSENVKVAVVRGGQRIELNATLAPVSEVIPDKLPPALADRPKFMGDRPATGLLVDQKIAEFANVYLAYVPESYDPALQYGVVVWFHEPGPFPQDELLTRWKPVCEANNLILLAPRSVQADKWLPTEVDFVGKVLEEFRNRYSLDPTRSVFYGRQAGGGMALLTASRKRDLVRGLVLVDAPPSGSLSGENEPSQPLSFFLAWAKKSQAAPVWQSASARLREAKFSVVSKELDAEQPRELNDVEFAELVRWIDSLDAV
ncbi:MAG TPA: PDZ domain-containing protein, partial [Pirellulales bacterium]